MAVARKGGVSRAFTLSQLATPFFIRVSHHSVLAIQWMRRFVACLLVGFSLTGYAPVCTIRSSVT